MVLLTSPQSHGVSGKNYTFVIKIDGEETQLFQYFDDEEMIEFIGNASTFKTFIQD